MKALVVKLKRKDCPGSVPGLSKTLMLLLCFFSLLNAGCKKDIEEPKHKNKGKNVIYLKIDEQEFLIKEGFSLNKNVIRADIGGNFDSDNASYYEYIDFGEQIGSLSFNYDLKTSNETLGSGSFDMDFTLTGNKAYNLVNAINLPFFSLKHNKNIMIRAFNDAKGGSEWLAPIVKIEKNDRESKRISGTYFINYQDESDTTLRGNLYVYFDLEYEN